jgi:hypothetical protein
VEEQLKKLYENKAKIEKEINRLRYMGENVTHKSHPYLVKNYNDVLAQIKEANEKKKMKESDPCWDGYEMVGKKKKDGKEVPNCVPKK